MCAGQLDGQFSCRHPLFPRLDKIGARGRRRGIRPRILEQSGTDSVPRRKSWKTTCRFCSRPAGAMWWRPEPSALTRLCKTPTRNAPFMRRWNKPADNPRYQLVMGGWEHARGAGYWPLSPMDGNLAEGRGYRIQRTKTPHARLRAGNGSLAQRARFSARVKIHALAVGSQAVRSFHVAKVGQRYFEIRSAHPRNGKLSYTTPPLAGARRLRDAISATIYASSSNTNMVLIGRLFDVHPDGTSKLISRGALVGSLRELDRAKVVEGRTRQDHLALA